MMFFSNSIQIPLFNEDFHGEPSQKALAILHEKIGALEFYLKQRKWVSGEFLTIADFSVLATFSAIYVSFPGKKYRSYFRSVFYVVFLQNCPIDLSKYVATLSWFEKCKAEFIGYADIEEDSKNALGNFLKSKGIELKLKL